MPLTDANRLSIQRPHLVAEWDVVRNGTLTPNDFSTNSHSDAFWICVKCAYSWSARIQSRSNGHNCPACAGVVITDANRLSLLRPHLIAEWDAARNGALTPADVSIGSKKKVHWKCTTCAHCWKAAIGSCSSGHGCPACSRHAVSDANRLSLLRPHLITEWDVVRNGTLKPEDVSIGSKKKVHWKCLTCAYQWETAVFSRSKGHGCLACSGNVVSDANRLNILRPHLIIEWDVARNGALTPADVSFGSPTIAHWICTTCTHQWSAPICRRSQGHGCPACRGLAVNNANRLSLLRPDLVAEWDAERNGTLTPDDVTFGTSARAHWKCTICAHRWDAVISSRANASTSRGCPACRGLAVNDTNRLSLLRPFLAAEWDTERNGSLSPENITVSSGVKVHWKCAACTHRWEAVICNRSRGRGCPRCAARLLGSGTSKIEVAVAAEFAHIFGDGTIASVQGDCLATPHEEIDASYATSFVQRGVRADITARDVFSDGRKLIVEWDGAYTHAGDDQQRRDRSKTAHLEALGHAVVRLREAPLSALTPACVCVEATPHNSEPRIKAAVDAALRHVRERYGALLTVRSTRVISEYLASAQTQNQAAAAAYLAHTEATATTATTQTTLDAFLAGDATNERPVKRMRIDDGGGGGGGG